MFLSLKSMLLSASLLTGSFLALAQEIKLNASTAPLLIPNVAFEYPVAPRLSVQAELLVSPWKSFLDRHLQVYMGSAEGRYYFQPEHQGWFLGGYAGIGFFDMQKWNYWQPKVISSEDGASRVTSLYQRGFAVIAGIDGGYKWRLSSRWALEAYLGIGTSQSFYHGYYRDTNERYDGAQRWNKSGEIIPTRGGIMVNYRLDW